MHDIMIIKKDTLHNSIILAKAFFAQKVYILSQGKNANRISTIPYWPAKLDLMAAWEISYKGHYSWANWFVHKSQLVIAGSLFYL